jgi:hypothetical protein
LGDFEVQTRTRKFYDSKPRMIINICGATLQLKTLNSFK